jgi:hypothetical protein
LEIERITKNGEYKRMENTSEGSEMAFWEPGAQVSVLAGLRRNEGV